MSDLTNRLRDTAYAAASATYTNLTVHGWDADAPIVQGFMEDARLLREAASRIDQLEAALREINREATDTVVWVAMKNVRRIAHRALGDTA